jgi:site-specific recombinase XerD
MNDKHLKLLEGFKTYLAIKNFKQRGIEGKLRNARYFFEYMESNAMNALSFNVKDAENYRENLSVAKDNEGKPRFNPATINGAISELRLLFKYLISVNVALKNPFANIENMKGSEHLPKNILTIEETGKLLDSIEVKTKEDFKFKVVVEVLYSTGARIAEIENLTKADIDLERGIINIIDDKDRKDRIAPLTEYSVELLRIYLKTFSRDGKVFMHGRQRTLNRFINDRLKRLTESLEIPLLTCHGIRHTIATQMLKKGADLREIQELLGHKRIKNTEIYTRLMHEDLKKVIDELHPREHGESQ